MSQNPLNPKCKSILPTSLNQRQAIHAWHWNTYAPYWKLSFIAIYRLVLPGAIGFVFEISFLSLTPCKNCKRYTINNCNIKTYILSVWIARVRYICIFKQVCTRICISKRSNFWHLRELRGGQTSIFEWNWCIRQFVTKIKYCHV